MTKAYITEYSKMTRIEGSVYPPLGDESSIVAEQVVDFTAGVTPSATFNDQTVYIRVAVDATCCKHIAVGAVATTSKARMATNDREYFALGALAGKQARASFISTT